jgi:hypothetical protein
LDIKIHYCHWRIPKNINKLISISGWWLIYPSEKYENQLGLFFPTEWKNQINVPNHQPDIIVLKQKTII